MWEEKREDKHIFSTLSARKPSSHSSRALSAPAARLAVASSCCLNVVRRSWNSCRSCSTSVLSVLRSSPSSCMVHQRERERRDETREKRREQTQRGNTNRVVVVDWLSFVFSFNFFRFNLSCKMFWEERERERERERGKERIPVRFYVIFDE